MQGGIIIGQTVHMMYIYSIYQIYLLLREFALGE